MKWVLVQARTMVQREEMANATDGQLLESFLRHHDEASFTALMSCHAVMVMGVCQRVLQNIHDAEDAFQATLAQSAMNVFAFAGFRRHNTPIRRRKAACTRAPTAITRLSVSRFVRAPSGSAPAAAAGPRPGAF
jgi:hypothetical protein